MGGDREGEREDPEGRRRDHDLRPAGRQGSHRQEHHARARTPQGSRGCQAFRSSRDSPLSHQAAGPLQGTQVRESQRQEAVQRIQEVNCHQLISCKSLLSLSLVCDVNSDVTNLLCQKKKKKKKKKKSTCVDTTA